MSLTCIGTYEKPENPDQLEKPLISNEIIATDAKREESTPLSIRYHTFKHKCKYELFLTFLCYFTGNMGIKWGKPLDQNPVGRYSYI